jgi:hypothetical protein
MTNPLKGETTAFLGGAERVLRLGIGDMIELEQFVGKGVLEIMGSGMSYRNAVATIMFALKGGGSDGVDWQKTLAWCEGKGIAELNGIALRALAAAQPELSDDSKNAAAPGKNR